MNDLPGDAPRRISVAQFVNSFYLGGAEGQVVELLRSLRHRYRLHVASLHVAGPLLEHVRALGYETTGFQLRGSLAHPWTAAVVARVARWLKREEIDVLHSHDFFATVVGVPAAKLAGCKVVVGRLDLGHWHGPFRAAAIALATRMADHVIANAEAIRQMIISREGIPSDRVSVIPNGIDVDRFDQLLNQETAQPVPQTGGSPVAVLVANMNHEVKRQEDFLVALAYARAQGSPLQGFLVGDGPRRAQLEAMAEQLGLQGAAHFLGHRTDVPALLKRCTVGVLCSTAEGLSNAIMEGMAARLPMVVTEAGGNPELVCEGRGVLVPPQSPFELSKALTYVVEHPRQARKMGEAARAFIEAELSLDRMAQAHDELYSRLARGEAAQVSPFPRRPAPVTRHAAS